MGHCSSGHKKTKIGDSLGNTEASTIDEICQKAAAIYNKHQDMQKKDSEPDLSNISSGEPAETTTVIKNINIKESLGKKDKKFQVTCCINAGYKIDEFVGPWRSTKQEARNDMELIVDAAHGKIKRASMLGSRASTNEATRKSAATITQVTSTDADKTMEAAVETMKSDLVEQEVADNADEVTEEPPSREESCASCESERSPRGVGEERQLAAARPHDSRDLLPMSPSGRQVFAGRFRVEYA